MNLDDIVCPLCQVEKEDIDHMLIKCGYAACGGGQLLEWLGITRSVADWLSDITWAVANARGKTAQQEVYRMALAGRVYHVSKERNARVFGNPGRPPDHVVKQIIQEIHCRAQKCSEFTGRLLDLKFYP